MSIEYKDEINKELQLCGDKLNKTVSVLKSEYQNIRAGRANPHILDKISVDYYGTKTPINQMGNISVTDARSIVITLWDGSALKNVEKAILEANIGITPANDGKVLRLVFPELTEERRKDLVKQIKKMAEDAKIAARNIRRDILDAFKKMKTDKKISEDEVAVYDKEVEKLFSKSIENIDLAAKEKEKEVMTV
jgi:ribosome recycling factor